MIDAVSIIAAALLIAGGAGWILGYHTGWMEGYWTEHPPVLDGEEA